MNAETRLPDPLSRVRERVRVRARELRQSSPDAERLIWQRLRNRQLAGWKFRRQHPVGPYFADFACIEAQLIVELDGVQHFEPEAQLADKRRTEALGKLGFTVLRFDNRQALAETDNVLTAVLHWLDEHPPTLTCSARPGLQARAVTRASRGRLETPATPPTLSRPAGEGVNTRNAP